MSNNPYYIIINNNSQVPRSTWGNHKENPERDNHLFDSHRPFRGKDDVQKLNSILKRLSAYFKEAGFDPNTRSFSGRKMRSTYHSGRVQKKNNTVYSANHNDRNFDSEPEHIVKDKSGDNIEWNWCGKEFTFDEGEQKFYEMVFSEQLNYSNERYLEQGHSKRVKTMEKWRKNKQHCPEETIIMIGKMTNHPDNETSLSCFKEFMSWLNNWNEKNGCPFKVLNWAFHQDEQGAPHFHLRKVWYYMDHEKGFSNTGQEKALQRTSLKLPYPDKKVGRKNNLKVSFDTMCRKEWSRIIKSHGIELEETPKPKNEVGKSLEEYKKQEELKVCEIYMDLLQLAQLNMAMAEKVTDWEEIAKNADNADSFLKTMVEKAFRVYTDEERENIVDQIKGFYAGEMKKMKDEYQKEIAGYQRLLNPKSVVKKYRDWDMER